ncbi:CG0192-related protein [Streptosporangium longisporum]|uniref:Maltokinase N-terminal cap domain-containing protein n=1 Tax=Streptosporangium longisporum TaxID=46187 RepID=A0ABN3XPV0_9ACTN
MALIHRATLRPTKLELLATWLPGRDWYGGPAGEVERVAGFRFDDPAGEVGIETLLVRVGDGPVHQVPLTYRAAPLAGGERWLLGTVEHSVLGRRWIHDATGDPVYAAALASAILANTGQAEEFVQVDGRLEPRGLSMGIAGDATGGTRAPAVGTIHRVDEGDPALIVTDTVELAVLRRLDGGTALTGSVLTGTWPGQAAPAPLASAAPRHGS